MLSAEAERTPRQPAAPGAAHAAVFALFVALAVAHTWPLASGLGYWSRHDNADTILNEWVLAWIAHILPQHPLQLFDANIFYPEARTLAFSEHMIVQGLLGAPLFAAGVSPLVAYNVVLLSGFVLTAFSMYFVVARWTGDRAAGVLAGCLAAFNAHTFTRLPHLQALHVEFLPVVLLLLDRLLTRPRVLTGVFLGIAFALQGLTSYYWLVFTSFGVAAAAIVRRDAWWGRRAGDLAVPAIVAALTAAAILAPFLIPYYRVSTSLGFVRSLDDVALYSGGWRDYLSTPGRLHFLAWSHIVWGPGGKTPLFPGLVSLVLAAVALARIRGDVRVLMLAAVVLVSVLLSLGTNLPGYGALYAAVPLLRGIRAPVRAGHLVLVALAALSGIGLARARQGRTVAVRAGIAICAVLLATAETWVAPIGFKPAKHPTPAAAVLRDEPRAVVACFPMPPPNAPFTNAQYMLDSVQHWKPMLNGYSGFVPASYVRHWEALRDFPSPGALQYLKRVGVTHVVVYHEAGARSRFDALQPIAGDGDVTVFRLRWERIDDGGGR